MKKINVKSNFRLILSINYHLHNSYFKLNTGKVDDDFNGCFR